MVSHEIDLEKPMVSHEIILYTMDFFTLIDVNWMVQVVGWMVPSTNGGSGTLAREQVSLLPAGL